MTGMDGNCLRRKCDKVQLVGDDLFVTNVERLSELKRNCKFHPYKSESNWNFNRNNSCKTWLKNAGYTSVMSHRSGETEYNCRFSSS
jgi:enolase